MFLRSLHEVALYSTCSNSHTMVHLAIQCVLSHTVSWKKIPRGQLFWHVPSMLSKIDNIISISCDLNFFFLHSLLLVLTSGLICYGYYLTWNLNSDTFFDKRNTLLPLQTYYYICSLVVSVSVMISAESIGQLGFRFWHWT